MPQVSAVTNPPWVDILKAGYLPPRGVVSRPPGPPAQAASACAFTTFLLLNSSCPLTQIPACLPPFPFPSLLFFFFLIFSFLSSFLSLLFCPTPQQRDDVYINYSYHPLSSFILGDKQAGEGVKQMCYHPDSTEERSRKIQQLALGHEAEAGLSWQAKVSLLHGQDHPIPHPQICLFSEPQIRHIVWLNLPANSGIFSPSSLWAHQILILFGGQGSLSHLTPTAHLPFFKQTKEEQICKATNPHNWGIIIHFIGIFPFISTSLGYSWVQATLYHISTYKSTTF